MENPKNCQVCGRKNWVSKNFGAITCLPCAAFFRRTMAMALEFECICEKHPDKVRLFGCRGCRLKRCLDAGMEKEKVQAIKIRYMLKERQNEQMWLSKMGLSKFDAENAEVMKNLMQMGERISLIWHSSVPLPTEFLETTLERLLNSRKNLLSKYEEFSASSNVLTISFNKSAYLDGITKCGLPTNWLDCPPRSLYIRAALIMFGMLTALPAFTKLNIQDQMLQLIGANEVTTHLVLPLESLKLSSECMITPNGVSQIEMYQAMGKFYGSESEIFEQLPYDVFVKPMKAFAILNLDKLESTLLIYILLCTPTANLSKEASEILQAESEKFGKMLLRLQQHRFGEQSGAVRYLESLRLTWSCVTRARKFQEMNICVGMLHKGPLYDSAPTIVKSLK